MKKKSIIILAVSLILLFILSTFIWLFVDFKNSVRYARYEMLIAQKNKDSSVVEKYYDVEEIVDSMINDHIKETADDPYSALGAAMVTNMRPALIKKVKSDLEESAESENLDTEKMSNWKIFWYSFNDKSFFSGKIYKPEYFGKNKVKVLTGIVTLDTCNEFTWKKQNKQWKIVEIKQVKNPYEEAVKLK